MKRKSKRWDEVFFYEKIWRLRGLLLLPKKTIEKWLCNSMLIDKRERKNFLCSEHYYGLAASKRKAQNSILMRAGVFYEGKHTIKMVRSRAALLKGDRLPFGFEYISTFVLKRQLQKLSLLFIPESLHENEYPSSRK